MSYLMKLNEDVLAAVFLPPISLLVEEEREELSLGEETSSLVRTKIPLDGRELTMFFFSIGFSLSVED